MYGALTKKIDGGKKQEKAVIEKIFSLCKKEKNTKDHYLETQYTLKKKIENFDGGIIEWH